jgi:hypothetical protein
VEAAWLFNSHRWHSGTRNHATGTRHTILTGFRRRPGSAQPLPATTLPDAETICRLGEAAYLLL